MAQVLEFKLPDLGEGLTEAEIVRWMVEVGDVVAVDQPVVEVETAKAMVEVPCPYGGVVTARFGEEGAELPVGAPLLTVAVGEPASGGEGSAGAGGSVRAEGPAGVGNSAGAGALAGVGNSAGAAGSAGADGSVAGEGAAREEARAGGARAGEARAEGSGNVLVGYGTSRAPARRRRVRPGEPAPAGTSAAGSVPVSSPSTAGSVPPPSRPPMAQVDGGSRGADGHGHGSVAERADGPVPVISPLVRRLARENGLDLSELTGSGPDGLILRADVEYALRAAAARNRTLATGVPAPEAAGSAGVARSAGITGSDGISGSAGITGPAGAHSVSGAHGSPDAHGAPGAHGTPGAVRVPLKGVRGAIADKLSRSRREIPDATTWVDADATELLRARAVMNAVGGPKIPLLALLARICTAALARFPELNSTVDLEAREIVKLDRVHLGFAAQTDRGLVVPVVRDAHTRDAESLGAEFARLTEAARTGALTPAEVTGSTFTLNNYGVFGVDGSTPIINHPEAAMLGVGRIAAKPWVHEGELAVRQVVQLSLTFDHRVCDGGTAGGFLRYVADCVEQPAVLLRTL
ncbi:dihydrolipoamide acetyltransferase family protein [Streptomyces sp. NPDC005876]|uniref:dihydrolipoamide acetyltransferase family protein n=1 Tax=Streptomyces sp. NPDC005876 TaxID=3157076 RepID=UPI003406EF6F